MRSRLSVIEDKLLAFGAFRLPRNIDAPEVTQEQLLRAHTAEHLAND